MPMMARALVACALLFPVAQHKATAQEGSAPAPAPRVLGGTVVDRQTNLAIAAARVQMTTSAEEPAAADRAKRPPATIREVTSDARGAFRFEAVAPGRYRVTVLIEGFERIDYPGDVLVVADADPPPLVIACTLQITAEVQTHVDTPQPADAAAGSELNVLPGRAIVTVPGALEDVMRAFQARPGVAASQDDRNDMLVRGGGAIENATRIDGFDIPNPSHFGTPGSSGGALSLIAPGLIDRAVLRAGGFSVEFGERASSVLDLTLRSPAGDRAHGQAGASVSGAMAEAEGRFAQGRGSWMASARRSFLELAFSRGDDRAVPHYGDLVGRFDYSLSGKHRLEFLGIAGMDDVFVTSSGPDVVRDNQTVTMVGASLRSQWTAKTTTAVFLSYAGNHIDAEVGDSNGADGSDRSTEVEWRARAELRRGIGRDGALLAGVSMRRPDLRLGLDADGFHDQFGEAIAPLHSRFTYSYTDTAMYVEARAPSLGRLQLTSGVRVDGAGTTGHVFGSPRVNADYRLSEAAHVTGAYGVYRQSLPYVWIGSDIRNASLDPVRSRQALAGVSVRLPDGTRLALEGFDKRYDGYPVDSSNQWWHVLVNAASDYESPFVGRLVSEGHLLAHGVDATAARRVPNGIELNASYSYWRVAQRSDFPVPAALPRRFKPPSGGWLPADYDIRHQVRLGADCPAPGGWRLAAQLRYASGRPYTPYDVAASIGAHTGYMLASAFNTARYPAYHRLDVRLDRVFAVRRSRLELYAEVDNIYNRDNYYMFEWNSAKRQPRPIYQWGRQPLAGLRWEF